LLSTSVAQQIEINNKLAGKLARDESATEIVSAPNGPFWLAMRIYWPKSEALDGTWKQPPLLRAE
jgi:hypothetical protein